MWSAKRREKYMNVLSLTDWGVVCMVLLSITTQANAQDERRQQSRQVVQDHVQALGSVSIGKRLKLEDLQSAELRKIFDRCDFFLLRYPRYPVEVVPVAPLRVNNLFIVCDGKVSHVSDEIELQEFFLQRFPVATDDKVRADGVRSWLLLAQELHQDGFFSFGSPSVRTTDSLAEGVVEVTKDSGEGRLSVTMEFSEGKLSKVSWGGNVVPGTRRLK
jgi:hypothetical protein